MATDYTTNEIRSEIAWAAITDVRYVVPHIWDDAQQKVVMNRAAIRCEYRIEYYDVDGNLLPSAGANEGRSFADWPAQFLTDSTDIYAAITQDARNKGLIPAGVDEDY